MSSSSITTNTLNEQFEQASKEFEVHWEMGREAAKSADAKINEMISILHKQHPDWNFTKIAKEIWIKHEHLEGFTIKAIRGKLDETNLKLLPPPKPKETVADDDDDDENNNNKDIEQSHGTNLSRQRDNKVLEQSSNIGSSSSSSVASPDLEEFRQQKGEKIMINEAVDSIYDLEDETQQAEPQHVIYDDPVKQIEQCQSQIFEQAKEIQKLREDYERVIPPYEIIETRNDIIDGKKRTQTIHVDPYKRTAWSEQHYDDDNGNKKH